MKVINWTREKLKALEVAHAQAIDKRKPDFVILLPGESDKVEFGTDYAGRTIAYLKGVYAANPDMPAMPNNEGREGQ